MKHRGIDTNGDWIFGKGRNSYDTNNKAILTNVKTRLLSFYNDCFFDLEAGIDWWNLLGSKNLENLFLSIKECILGSYGVAKIVSFSTHFSQDRIVSISFSLRLIDNTITENQNVEVMKYA
ncbi:MAG: hypothetical protein LBT79_07970 [Elusimicrobiota bacterium]|jgi:hypothetical protein|nr:hypothetical protein [Elusimicrobiota bacterium]